MTTATSLILIAVGAILAFAISVSMAGINIQTVGAILIIVGGIGLAISMATLAGYAPWSVAPAGAVPAAVATPTAAAAPAAPTVPAPLTPPPSV